MMNLVIIMLLFSAGLEVLVLMLCSIHACGDAKVSGY